MRGQFPVPADAGGPISDLVQGLAPKRMDRSPMRPFFSETETNSFFDLSGTTEVIFVRFARNDNLISISFKILFDSKGPLLVRKTAPHGVAFLGNFCLTQKGCFKGFLSLKPRKALFYAF